MLRNVLLLLKGVQVDGQDALTQVQKLVSQVMGDITLEVEFDEDRHLAIQARFQTAEMRRADQRRFKPLELAGIGFLQVIQIFAYLVYFRPVVLLVDEPDSHLHPTAQERLVTVLADTARRFHTQVVVSTHSPSVIRALPPDARVIWMKEGKVQERGDTEGRRLMGWGLLDRRVLLMTEDKDAGMLQSLLAQWPDFVRQVAVWPFDGSSKLPSPEVLSGFVNLTGDSLKVILHRDRDFLMPDEIKTLSEPYHNAGHKMWLTRFSDVEAYWTEPHIVATHLGISLEAAEALLSKAVEAACAGDAALKKRREKRKDAINKINKNSELPHFGDADVENEACKYGNQHKVLGKDLLSSIRKIAQDDGRREAGSLGRSVPNGLGVHMAEDLGKVLQETIG